MTSSSYRPKVISLYKHLLLLGKEYPQGYSHFRDRVKKGFLKNRHLTNSDDIEKAIKHGEYIVKEVETLYYLKKYREMKRRYEEL